MKKHAFIISSILTSACSGGSPMAPSLDPMQVWALAHAHEVCVLNEQGKGVLVPIGEQFGKIIEPISYCNPAR